MKVYAQNVLSCTQEYFLNKKPLFQSVVIWCIVALILFAAVFVPLAPSEEVVKATGTVRPQENISPVSNAVTGRIKFIAYESGQTVKKASFS